MLRYEEAVKLSAYSVLSDENDSVLSAVQGKYQDLVKQGEDEHTAIVLMGNEIWEELSKKYRVVLDYEVK